MLAGKNIIKLVPQSKTVRGIHTVPFQAGSQPPPVPEPSSWHQWWQLLISWSIHVTVDSIRKNIFHDYLFNLLQESSWTFACDYWYMLILLCCQNVNHVARQTNLCDQILERFDWIPSVFFMHEADQVAIILRSFHARPPRHKYCLPSIPPSSMSEQTNNVASRFQLFWAKLRLQGEIVLCNSHYLILLDTAIQELCCPADICDLLQERTCIKTFSFIQVSPALIKFNLHHASITSYYSLRFTAIYLLSQSYCVETRQAHPFGYYLPVYSSLIFGKSALNAESCLCLAWPVFKFILNSYLHFSKNTRTSHTCRWPAALKFGCAERDLRAQSNGISWSCLKEQVPPKQKDTAWAFRVKW